MAPTYHSEWHRIWADEMAERARYRSVPFAKRFFFAVPGGGIRSSKYNVHYWRKAISNFETCNECGGRPTFFKGKAIL